MVDQVDTPALPPAVPTDLRRGGFWRRWLGALIDIIIVSFPLQILAAILFSMTAGTVQMDSGLFKSCAAVRPFRNR